MTAIFTGPGAGFARSSGTVLGGSGLLGSASTGRGGDNLMVNAATGNLVINRQDEFLTGPSHDIAIGRTYNSLAEVNDGDNNDKWQMSTVRKVFGLTGTLNAAGSKVRRQAGDGSVSTYHWATRGGVAAYWSSDGDGAHEKLVNASGVWTWTDGSSQYSEVYEGVPGDAAAWRIASYKDSAGAAQTFTYWSGTKLDKVIAASGEFIQYFWSATQPGEIERIATGLSDRTITRTYYEYETYAAGQRRLSKVKVDLSPDYAGITDGHSYETTYQYNTAGLVSAIIQSDGSRTDITYDAAGRVYQLIEKATSSEDRTTTLTYGANFTNVYTPDGQVTRLEYAGGSYADNAIWNWGASGVDKESVPGGVLGDTAVKYTSSTGVNWSGIAEGVNAVAGQTYKFTLSLMAVAGHATEQTFGLYGNTSYWGNAAQSSARIISGPGQISQWGPSDGGLWRVSGLSATEATRVEVVRTYTVTEPGGAYVYVDHPGGFRDGQQVIYAAPSLELLNSATVSAPAAIDWNGGGVSEQAAGTINGQPAVRLTTTDTSWSGTSDPYGYLAKAGETYRLSLNLQAVAGSSTEQSFGLYGNTSGWGSSTSVSHARIVSGPGTIVQNTTYGGGIWKVVGLSTTTPTQVEVYRTFDREEYGNAYLYVKIDGGFALGQQLLFSGPAVTKFSDYQPADRQLTKIIAPAAYSGAAQQTQAFEYDPDGNLIKSTAPNGAVTNYQYDDRGNLTLIDNPVGADVYRYYDSANRLVREADYGSDENHEAVTFYTSYAYDSAGQLRYRVSPDGKVAEYLYDGYGRVLYEIEYTGVRYDSNGVTLTESGMDSWRNSLADKTKRHVKVHSYDARGNRTQTWDYAAADSNGSVTGDYGATLTYYTYDHLGRLLSTNRHGETPETYLYDGLNRVIGSSDPGAGVTTVFFDDANTRTVVRMASGLTRTQTYSKAGDLIGEVESSRGLESSPQLTDISAWGFSGLSRTQTTNAAGQLAYRYQVLQTGTWAGVSNGWSVAAGDTVRFRLTLKNDGTGGTHRFGIHGGTEGWGTNATTDARTVIVSGPGRVSQIEGGLWQIDGLSTGEETTIEYVRTYPQAANFGFYFYVNSPAVTQGAGVILSAPSMVRSDYDSALAISAQSSNSYDRLGRLRVHYDEFDNGNRTYFVYDNAGRKTGELNDYGHLAEFVYDTSNRLIATVKYANGVIAGALTTLQDPNNTLTISDIRPTGHSYDLRQWTVYDVGGRVLQTIDGTGAVTGYEYDGKGRVVRTTVYANRVSTSGWAASPPTNTVGVSANSAADSVTRTFYDRDGNVRGVLDGEGYLVEYVYDATGKKIEERRFAQVVPEGYRASSTFATLRANAAPTSTSNRITRYVYDLRGLLRYTLEVENVATNSAKVTGYDYNPTPAPYTARPWRTVEYYNPTTVSNYSLEAVSAAVAGHANDRVTTLTYDKAGRVSYSVDPAGTATYKTYDYAGNVTKVRHGSNAATEQITRYWYDARGNVRYSVDPAGYLTKYGYTVGGRLLYEYRHDNAVSVGDSTTIAQVAALATGNTTNKTYQYDNLGRVVREYDGTGASTIFAYWATGQLSNVYAGYDSASGTLDRSRSVFVYDNAGRLMYDYNAYDDSELTVAVSIYNARGDKIQVNDRRGINSYASYDRRGAVTNTTDGAGGSRNYLYNAFGEVTDEYDGSEHVAHHYYDNLGRRTQTDDFVAATVTTYTRFGEVATVTRAGGTTSFEYDKMGRVTKITDARGFYETFAYNEVGDRISSTNKLGGTTTYTYDRRGLKLSETLPMSSVDLNGNTVASTVTNTFAYDSRGNLVTETRAAGLAEQNVTQYEYDRANRLIHTIGQAYHGITPHTYYYYDARGNLTSKVAPGNARTVYFYDDLDRVVVEINAAGTYTGYAYDGNGNVTSVKVYETLVSVPADGGSEEEALVGPPPLAPPPPGNFRHTTFEYDNVNRLRKSHVHGVTTGSYFGASWVASSAALTTEYEYDLNGNVVKTIDPNGNTTWAYYDELNRKTHQVVGGSVGGSYMTEWTYDANGNVTRERRYWNNVYPTTVEAAPSVTQADYLDRTTDYTYDLMGNRKTETRYWVYVHDGSGNHTYAHAQISYNYNGLGQVTLKTEATGDAVAYQYDTAGRLTLENKTSFIDFGGASATPTTEYRYDGLGNLTRTRQMANGNAADRITTYGYDGGKLRWVTDAEGNDGSGVDGKTTFYWYDAAGNVQYEYYTRYDSNNAYAGGAAYDGVLRVYDGLGRVTQQWDTAHVNGNWNGAGPVTYTTYNAYGDVAGVQVGNGSLQQNQYDKAGRLVGSNAGDGAWKYFGYDKAGNQTIAVATGGADLTGHTLASILPYVGQNNVNATYTTYDSRNLATQVIEEGRELSTSTTQMLTSTRGYNAFGEVYYEIAANGARIDYTYNNMGRVIRIESPTVTAVSESGASSSVRPTEHLYYDVGGRLVAQRDANGNLTRLTLLANTGYGGSQALVTHETHADGGVKQTKYDVHGDARVLIDEMGRQIQQAFDQMGRVIQVYNIGSGLNDFYEYDGAGHQLKHWNSLLGSGNAEVTNYDIQGRVSSKRAFGGDTTTSSYTFYASIGGFGGWQEVTTMANNRQKVEQTDIFGRVRYKSDLGGHVFNFNYDGAGQLSSMTHGSATQTYAYFNTGKLKTITLSNTGAGSTPTTSYSYDVMGNVTYQGTWDPLYGTTQTMSANYDALGRMTSWTEAGNGTSPAATSAYAYDAKGNVRSVTSTFWYLDAQGNQYVQANGQQLWYRYDAMDRVVVSKGALSGGTIIGGTNISYNAAGQRTTVTGGSSALNWTGWRATTPGSGMIVYADDPYEYEWDGYNWTNNGVATFAGAVIETYYYDAAGRLDQVRVASETGYANGGPTITGSGTMGASVLRANFDYDAMGRLTLQEDIKHTGSGINFSRALAYDSAGRITNDNTSTLRGTVVYVNNTTNTYLTGTSNMLGAANYSETDTYVGGSDSGAPDTRTDNTYVWWDSAMQSTTAYKPDVGSGTTYTTTFNYNAFAQATSISVADGRPRTVTFRNSADGQALRRDEADNGSGGDPHEVYYRMGGKQLGKTGNNGTADVSYLDSTARRTATQGTGAFQGGLTYGSAYADFGLDYEAINSFSQGSDGGLYEVQAGDTLQGIAQSLWGDASLWYKLAEANGLSAGAALSAGRSLVLPAGVQRVHNNASTFKPYDPSEVIGDTSPTTPKPAKGKKCGSFGMILLAVVAVAVATIVTAGAASVLSGQAFAGILGGMVSGTAVGGVGMGAWVAGGAIGGAAGSIASQGVGLATGIQEKFSWKGVAMAGIAGSVGGFFQGLGNAAGLVEGGKGLGGVGGFLSRGGVTSAVARGVVGNVAMQGIAVATGLQGKFNWAGVAAAGVGAAAGFGMGRLAGDSWGGQFASSAASAIANAATRSAITGESFGDNLRAAIPDVIGQAIGGAIARGIAGRAIQRQASTQFSEIVSSAEGQVVLASIGQNGKAVTPKELLDHLEPTLLSGQATEADIAQAEANLEKLVDDWGLASLSNGGNMTAVNLAKNDALRLVYAAMFLEMPRFQWTGVGMIVGGEAVRAEIERLGGLIEGARKMAEGFEGPAWMLAGPSADQMQYLQNKIVEGQVSVVTDIGKLALTYRAAGGNARAALQLAKIADGSDAREGFRLQAISDRAWAAGNRRLSAQSGRDAAISFGIHEQTRLQSILWDDKRVQIAARSLNIFGGVNTNIEVKALGKTIVAPETGSPWFPDFFDPSKAFGAGPWDLEHRIDIATNAFNKMHDWVYAPSAMGQRSAMTTMRNYISKNHFDQRAVWSSSGGGT